MKEGVLALPFDQYQRYRLVADLLQQLRGDGPPLRLLDVGGRTAVLRDFLDDARIDLVDLESSDSAGLVLGDGSRLPFKDRSFDAVCAFDTLEHVPPPLRKAFVAECRRVARRWVVLAGPYAHPRVVEAEEVLQRFLDTKFGERHRYLDEHRHHGLPARAEVEQQLESQGARVVSIGHGNLERWLVLQCLSMYLDYDPALRPVAQDFQRFYNSSLYSSDHAEPVYRHVVVAALEGAPLPRGDHVLALPRAPEGALRQVFDLGAELVQFDRERTRWRAERATFEKVVADLRADLAGHQNSLGDLQTTTQRAKEGIESERRDHASKVRGLEESLATVEADLQGHKRALAEEQTTRARVEQELAAHRQALAEVRADLAGHRSALEIARADLEGHKSEVQALRAELARLQAGRTELEDALARSDGELRKTLAIASGLELSLAQREAVYESLRAELRSRRRNLMRVFRPLQ